VISLRENGRGTGWGGSKKSTRVGVRLSGQYVGASLKGNLKSGKNVIRTAYAGTLRGGCKSRHREGEKGRRKSSRFDQIFVRDENNYLDKKGATGSS